MKRIIINIIIAAALVGALTLPLSAADIPQEGLIGRFKLDGDLTNSVNGEEAVRLDNHFDVLDEQNEWVIQPLYYDGVDGQSYGISNHGGDGEVHYIINTKVSPGNGDFTMGMWILDERSGGTGLEYMRYGQRSSYVPSANDGEYTYFSISSGNVNDGDVWLKSGPLLIYHTGTSEDKNVTFRNEKTNFEVYRGPYSNSYCDYDNMEMIPWIHVVASCVLDRESDTYTITLYQNGKAINVCDGVPNPYVEGEDNFIYCIRQNWDFTIPAYIDDIVIYNRALSADEVANLYGSYDLSDVQYAPPTGSPVALILTVTASSGIVIVLHRRKFSKRAV